MHILFIRKDDFKTEKVRRSSSGIIIYIKDNIRKGVKLIKHDIDCLIWLKFDKNYFHINEDMYVAVAYIAPENSPVHNLYDIDIFKVIQDDISFFQNRGRVFILGDLNSRTSKNPISLIMIGQLIYNMMKTR